MKVVMFQDRFAELVRTGVKRQTIRTPRKRPIVVGDRLSLRWWSDRPYVSPQIILAEGVCTFIGAITLRRRLVECVWPGGTVETISLPDRLDAFAVADGFEDWSQLWEWFQDAHGPFVRFDGVLIKW